MKQYLKSISAIIPRELYYSNDYRKIKKLLASGEDTKNYENILLARQLKNAINNVPFYESLELKATDVTPDNAQEILKIFPIITKKTIMDHPDQFISKKINVSNPWILKRTSGGSTGQGIRVYRNINELMIERAFYDFKWGKYGFGTNDKIVRMGVDGIKLKDENPVSFIGNKMLISPYHFNEEWINEIYEEIKTFEPKLFHAYPSSFEYLVRFMHKRELHLETVKAILLASERVTVELLQMINEVFPDVPVLFSYGLTERSNLAWGSFEDNKIVYQTEELYGFTENIINSNGVNEIVGTSYWNLAMPFIRYATQDIGTYQNGFIYDLNGREQDFLVTKNNEKIPGFSVIIDKETWDYIEIFQIIQYEIGKIELHIKPKLNYTSGIGEWILEKQNSRWSSFFDIKLVINEKLGKTQSGKSRLVVNNLK